MEIQTQKPVAEAVKAQELAKQKEEIQKREEAAKIREEIERRKQFRLDE